MAEKVIAHTAANGEICRQGFVKDLVNGADKCASLMKISRDDINNKVRAIQGPHKQRKVSPVILYHDIRCPSLSTNTDSSVSASLNSERTHVENPSEILANQAIQILQPTSGDIDLFNSLAPKCIPAGTENSRSEGFQLAKHKHANIPTMICCFPL